VRGVAGGQQAQQQRRQACCAEMGSREVANVVEVRDKPRWEVGCEGEFEEDGEDGCREEGSRNGGPGICEDGSITKSTFCSCRWVVGRRDWAEEEEGDSVRGDEGEGCEDEGCRADGVE
jgi:hypothetical protein